MGAKNADGRAVEGTATDVFKTVGDNKQQTPSARASLLVF